MARDTWPELTNLPSGTHKPRDGLSENLSAEVSAHTLNPTGIFVEAGPHSLGLIRLRSEVCGRHPVAISAGGGPGISGGFPRPPCRAVLTMSAYAYREAFSLVLAKWISGTSPRPASIRACRSASRRWRHALHQTSTRT
jgi:hypothetical protein